MIVVGGGEVGAAMNVAVTITGRSSAAVGWETVTESSSKLKVSVQPASNPIAINTPVENIHFTHLIACPIALPSVYNQTTPISYRLFVVRGSFVAAGGLA
jgi:hypothetical protein